MFRVDSKQIRALLFKHRLSVKEFADRCDLNFFTASKITREGARTNAKTLAKVAAAFGVDAERLLEAER